MGLWRTEWGTGERLGEWEPDARLVQPEVLSEVTLPALKDIKGVDTMGRSEGTTRKTSPVGAAEVYPAMGTAGFKVRKPRGGEANGCILRR